MAKTTAASAIAADSGQVRRRKDFVVRGRPKETVALKKGVARRPKSCHSQRRSGDLFLRWIVAVGGRRVHHTPVVPVGQNIREFVEEGGV